MEKLVVKVGWSEKNFSALIVIEGVEGFVLVTRKDYTELQTTAVEALHAHVEGLREDGLTVPDWLASGTYELVWELDTAALLRVCEAYTSLSAISKASGVNLQLLSHYANGLKKPSDKQRARILDGVHAIGRGLSAMA